jgi:hypothetical protein
MSLHNIVIAYALAVVICAWQRQGVHKLLKKLFSHALEVLAINVFSLWLFHTNQLLGISVMGRTHQTYR